MFTCAVASMFFAMVGCSSSSDTTETKVDSGSSSSIASCVGNIAWYNENSEGVAKPVGTKTANSYGLYDMLGNAVEWASDCYHENFTGAPTDGTSWSESTCTYRVIRGGCYGLTARGVRASMRDGVEPNFYGSCAPGVRCVRTSSTVPATAKVTLEWVSIAAGSFNMGCSTGDTDCYDNEKPTHPVTVAAFEMMKYEATQQQYFDQMNEVPWSQTACSNCAATYVNWDNAKAFCEAVGGRLPTEAEWEYAARGGTTTKYYCGN